MSKRTSPYERELDGILAALPGQAGPAAADPQSGGNCLPGSNRQPCGDHSPAPPKPSLLLHACCGPCSSYVIEYLARYFAITIYYYNPNIHPGAEYERRRDELLNFLPRFPAASGIQVVEGRYDPEDFYRATGVREEPDLQNEAEKGERCRRCYEFRMRAAWQYACSNAFDWFTTTLSISPFKDADKIDAIGRVLEAEAAAEAAQAKEPAGTGGTGTGGSAKPDGYNTGGYPRFLPSDFKKKGGFKRSLELSAEYGLYRQDYCGCVYSKANRKLPLPPGQDAS